jgi:replication factor A3
MHITDTFVEFIGTVKDDLTLRALTTVALGNSLDLKAVNAVVEFAHSAKGAGVLA